MAEVNMEQLLNCALCPNMCRCDCPVLQALAQEKVAPAAKARFAAMHMHDHLSLSEEIIEALANCLGCRGCTVLCPFPELNLCDELLNSRLKEHQLITLPFWEPYLANLKKYGSPYGQKPPHVQKTGKGAEVIYFAGCTTLANRPQSLAAVENIFQQAKVSYQLMDEDCCGYPAETWGNPDLAYKLATENYRKFKESGAKTLVTGCPECWLTFSSRYPEWNLELPLEIIPAPTFFLKLLEEHLLQPKVTNLSTVSYHDPCIWARTAGIIEEPRSILNRIPNLTVIEPLASKDRTHCCGGGRMFQLSFPKTAESIAVTRLQEFPAQSAIVTSCPFCLEGLTTKERKVIDLAELLAEACS